MHEVPSDSDVTQVGRSDHSGGSRRGVLAATIPAPKPAELSAKASEGRWRDDLLAEAPVHTPRQNAREHHANRRPPGQCAAPSPVSLHAAASVSIAFAPVGLAGPPPSVPSSRDGSGTPGRSAELIPAPMADKPTPSAQPNTPLASTAVTGTANAAIPPASGLLVALAADVGRAHIMAGGPLLEHPAASAVPKLLQIADRSASQRLRGQRPRPPTGNVVRPTTPPRSMQPLSSSPLLMEGASRAPRRQPAAL